MTLTIRWTLGAVSSYGLDALALSIQGAHRVFGASARYIVCVNTIEPAHAQARLGSLGRHVEWHDSNPDLPNWLKTYLDEGMAEGVAWKLAPPRLPLGDHVLAMDNDVILWRMPTGIREWLADGDSLLIAEDVQACYGQFARFCPESARNSGIIGFPPGYDIEGKLRRLVEAAGVRLGSETDEQGLQVAAITAEKHRVVSVDEVSICGYYRPHRLEIGSCGAHFVGVNTRRPAPAHRIWSWKKAEVERLVRPTEDEGAVAHGPQFSRVEAE